MQVNNKVNGVIAKKFLLKAEALDKKGERYKYRALSYRRAARTLNELEQGVDQIYTRSWLVGLQKINGIGNRLAHEIENYLKTDDPAKKTGQKHIIIKKSP
ncbi:hypothetical protein KKF61_03880 [Patescibacteria group bacterium]|nr:hypothetical protein [Patescibacteria group bacterium]MBU0963945.1 hypothetical protein [Patescibacteria group bacterium]